MAKVAILATPLTKWLLASAGLGNELWQELPEEDQDRVLAYAEERKWVDKRGYTTRALDNIMKELIRVAKQGEQK